MAVDIGPEAGVPGNTGEFKVIVDAGAGIDADE